MEISNKLNLYPALLKVQGELEPLRKNSQGFGYKYAQLAAIIDKVQAALNAAGIVVLQCPVPSTKLNHAGLRTLLVHAASGEYIESTAEVPCDPGKGMNASQGYGSALTYARKYALLAMVGVATEDDDAATATLGKVAIKPSTVSKLSDAQLVKATKKVSEIALALRDMDEFDMGIWLANNPKEVEALRWIKKNFPAELKPLTNMGLTV